MNDSGIGKLVDHYKFDKIKFLLLDNIYKLNKYKSRLIYFLT